MAPKQSARRDFGQALVESYAVNERMNQVVLEHLDPEAWRVKADARQGRTIAALFAHVHNVRRKWLRLSAPDVELPAALDARQCSPAEARVAFADGAARCCEMLRGAPMESEPRPAQFRRDGWARAWPAGPAMAAYMITHEAHHRGQACMLAHQLGFPLADRAVAKMSAWERLWAECGFGRLG